VFGYPEVAAAEVAVRTVGTWLNAHPGALATVIFNVFGDDDRDAYEAVLSPAEGHVEH
jgi:O-acetyl-ADP-ribose deacetylase (regulator of RNase III)